MSVVDMFGLFNTLTKLQFWYSLNFFMPAFLFRKFKLLVISDHIIIITRKLGKIMETLLMRVEK